MDNLQIWGVEECSDRVWLELTESNFTPKNLYLVPSKTPFYRVLDHFESYGRNEKQKQTSGMGIPDDHVKQVDN